MTPIKIEPNSGTKMAGVKVRTKDYYAGVFVEIKYVGETYFIAVTNDEIETYQVVSWDWLLYEEPKAEKKKVLKSPAIFELHGDPCYTHSLFIDEETAKKECMSFIKWPARVVLKNVKQTGNDGDICANLYFEVEE